MGFENYLKLVVWSSREAEVMDLICEGVDLFFSERYCSYRNVVAVVGLLWLSWLTLKTLKALAGDFCAFFLAPLGISRINLKNYGSWAVVTGASEGIGRGYALELARRGLNVVIMSRSQEKLKKVEDEIKEKYKREVVVIPVDFSDGMDIYPNIAEQLKDLDIGVLINNIGLSYEYPEFLNECPADRLYKMIEINCQSMVQMTKILLPKLLEKKGGVIVNLSSVAAELGAPMYTVYNATKSFVMSFSAGLYKEYSRKNIIVQCVNPFYVATSMTGIRRTSLMISDGVGYTRAAVATIGIKRVTYGCISHTIQGYLLSLIPSCILHPLALSSLKSARVRYLKKKAKAK